MKRLLFLLAAAALALPATALAKGPSEATITGPGLGKAIKISGQEVDGSPIMNLADAAGFFPAAFGQTPDPMSSAPPKSNLGPKYSIDYAVPGGNLELQDPPGSLSVREARRLDVHAGRAADLRHADARAAGSTTRG